MDHFLRKYNLQKFTQGKTDNLNRPTSIKEIELVANNHTEQKSPRSRQFHM